MPRKSIDEIERETARFLRGQDRANTQQLIDELREARRLLEGFIQARHLSRFDTEEFLRKVY